MTIRIENLTKRHKQYRIDHKAVCVKVGKCFCQQGRRGAVASAIHVPGGKGSMTGPLHPAVALIPAVAADARGPRPSIKIHGSPAPEKPVEKAEEETPQNESANDESASAQAAPTGEGEGSGEAETPKQKSKSKKPGGTGKNKQ